jgi:hypothetical protein
MHFLIDFYFILKDTSAKCSVVRSFEAHWYFCIFVVFLFFCVIWGFYGFIHEHIWSTAYFARHTTNRIIRVGIIKCLIRTSSKLGQVSPKCGSGHGVICSALPYGSLRQCSPHLHLLFNLLISGHVGLEPRMVQHLVDTEAVTGLRLQHLSHQITEFWADINLRLMAMMLEELIWSVYQILVKSVIFEG